MAELRTPIFRKDDLFYKRLDRTLKRLGFMASWVRRRNVNAIPPFYAELWELVPIIEKGRKDKDLIQSTKEKLNEVALYINTKSKKVIAVDYIIPILLEAYMDMRNSLFIYELKQEEEETSNPVEAFLEDALS